MSVAVTVSWRDMVQLVDSIRSNLRHITEYNSTLEEQLRVLGTSFLDEDIAIIQNHVTTTKRQIENAVPEFEVVLRKMLEYAQETKLAEAAIEN
jgi:hypothetical protein